MVIGRLHFIMLKSHRLFAITTVRLALEVHVLDAVICLKVFFCSLMLLISVFVFFLFLAYFIADFV